MMKISASTSAITSRLGDEAGIRLFAKAGFEALDFGMFYNPDDPRFTQSDADFTEYFSRLGKVARESGTEIFQTHSPMPNYLYSGDEEPGDPYLDLQIKAIRASSLMGASYIVIHPVIPRQYRYDTYRAETREINLKYYGKLRPYAEEYGIKIAVENMFNWDPEKKCICPTVCSSAWEMKDYVDMMGRDWFVNCLDIGHCLLTGTPPEEMIRELGDYIGILHIHDNDGVDDLHQAPHTGVINWDAVCTALKEIGYSGTFSFEADSFFHTYGPTLFEASTKMLYEIGHDFVTRYEL